ncbi:IS110 family transposase [Streptomyces nigrescens]|uniref:IS110 family transposase n=1 Tax=Streptomyces nigrescens TaxID=1920 RepID=UPI002B1CEECA|nr:transposase [Streptomyces libani]
MTYGSVGKDAFVIADTARVRRDPQPLHRSDEIAVDLRIPTVRRFDPSADRTRAIHRLRAPMPEYLPALERAFDHSVSESALVLPDAGSGPRTRRPDRPRPPVRTSCRRGVGKLPRASHGGLTASWGVSCRRRGGQVPSGWAARLWNRRWK